MTRCQEKPACSASSVAAGESLWGTAPCASRFVLLEVRRGWAAKPLKTQLPETTLEWLRAADAAKQTRIGFIRRPRREGPHALYLVDSETRLSVRVDLDTLEDVVRVAVDDGLDGQLPAGAAHCDDPLVLVCAHGRRDVCCAKLGAPLYEALCRQPGLDVWQSTHLGGHRFAPVVATLPDGYSYGRVPIERAGEFAQSVRAGRVFDAGNHLRGAMQYEPRVQAALCAQWAETPAADVRFVRQSYLDKPSDPDARFRAVVTLEVDAVTKHLFVDGHLTDGVIKSCGADPSAVARYEVHAAPCGYRPVGGSSG